MVSERRTKNLPVSSPSTRQTAQAARRITARHFLPATFQGTRIGTGANSIANIRNPKLSPDAQRRQLDVLQAMNRDFLRQSPENRELEGVIESYELAYRMQTAVPNVLDLAKEPETHQGALRHQRKSHS